MTAVKPKCIVMVAGGTGGHVMPALAIAKELIARGYHIEWIGGQRLEAMLVPKAQIPLHQIQQTGVRQRGIFHWLMLPFSLLKSVCRSISILRKTNPVCIIGMGGYLTVPVGIAAKLLWIPMVLHEQNAIAGLSNKLLRPFSKQCFCAFPQAFGSGAALVTGNPVRKEISQVEKYRGGSQRTFNILIFGGSLGAKALNEIVPQALRDIPASYQLSIVHQTGEATQEIAEQAYQGVQHPVQLVTFIDDMAGAYAWADLVISRSGALTVSEIATAGRAAIFIPYPHAVDDHQTINAMHLVRQDAALLIQEKELTPSILKKHMIDLIENPTRLQSMADNARKKTHAKALAEIVDWIDISVNFKRA